MQESYEYASYLFGRTTILICCFFHARRSWESLYRQFPLPGPPPHCESCVGPHPSAQLLLQRHGFIDLRQVFILKSWTVLPFSHFTPSSDILSHIVSPIETLQKKALSLISRLPRISILRFPASLLHIQAGMLFLQSLSLVAIRFMQRLIFTDLYIHRLSGIIKL